MTPLEWKNAGNEALKSQEFQKAIECYTNAINEDSTQAVFYSNRAQAYIKTEAYGLAIKDATTATKLDPRYTKAFYRRAIAYAAILDYKSAIKDLKEVLRQVPGDKLALNYHNQFVKILKKQKFEQAIRGEDEVLELAKIRFDSMSLGKTEFQSQLEIKVLETVEKQPQVLEIEGMNQSFIDEMVSLFKKDQRLPKKWAYAIIVKATELFAKDAVLTEIDATDVKLTVCGDTHGQFYDLLNIFEKFGQVSDNHTYLFNGDFVDRGSWSTEVAFLLYSLKIVYPSRIFINRGNHETSGMNDVYGFAGECKAKYSETLYKLFSESFGSLPMASLINNDWLVMHGGLFSNDDVTLDDIRKIDRFKSVQPPKEGIEMELLWTDPQEEDGRTPNSRGIGIQFGPDVTKAFCEKNSLKGIIRSHQVRMEGYQMEHDGKLITVFSAPNYCDTTGNKGAVVEIHGDSFHCTQFSAVPHPDVKPMAYTTNFGY